MREGTTRPRVPESEWRLLLDGPADGAWNMAVDEAIARAVGDGLATATLRFYTWATPTVSLGYLQTTSGGVDLAACREQGIAVVRRVTGGRAVLHAAELTYSVAVPLEGAWRGLSIGETFAVFCHGLIAGLAHLGVAAELGEGEPRSAGANTVGSREAGPRQTDACFLLRRMPAILVGGRKLIGSAQRRWERCLLQHGSILLDFDPHLHQAVFPAWSRTHPTAAITCLHSVLGRLPTHGEVRSALVAGWEEVFGRP
ncbi:MAG TPA: lipoate--protein ligase family protein, partial [Candidatus Methylomirabilis sp.]|nr:lipoate--protein ligase family protein [Candidatus Methylomirabilis sp.]